MRTYSRKALQTALAGILTCLTACSGLSRINVGDIVAAPASPGTTPQASPNSFQAAPALNLPVPFAAPEKFKVEALQQGSTVQTHNRLARAFLKQQREQSASQPNQIFSPLSLSLALHMVANGTAGSTRAELQQALGLPEGSLDALNQDNEILLKSLVTAEDQVLLRIASSFWIDPERPMPTDPSRNFKVDFQKGYQDTLKNHYLSPAQVLDFDRPDATRIINEWVNQATNAKIPTIISDTSDPALIAILLNAIYFKANWKYQFKKADTRPMAFQSTPKNTIQAQTMYLEAPLKGREASLAHPYQLVELPYGQSDRLVMDIFLPAPRTSLEEMLKVLESKDVPAWFENIEAYRVGARLYLPRFKFEQETTLNTWLKGQGLPELFNPDLADLSVMLRDPTQPERKIGLAYVSEVFQKALIEVNEEGTEAAAVTRVRVSCSGICPTSAGPSPVTIRVDRPFLTVVRDKLTGVILFTGLISKPEASS